MIRLFPLVLAVAIVGSSVSSAIAGPSIYATSYYSNSAFAVNSDGTTTVFNTPIAHASGITIDSAGNVYVGSESDNSILKFTAAGTLIGTFTTDHISAPVGMAFDAAGHLFVANNSSGNVTEYTSGGAYITTFATGFNAPEGLLIDSSGNILVSDILNGAGNGVVKKFNSSGTFLNSFSNGLSYPGQIAEDSAGNLYVSNAGGNFIGKYNSAGVYQGQFAFGTGSNDYGVAYDAATNTFYQGTFGPTPNSNGAIQHFDANGQSLGYLATDQPTAYFIAVVPTARPTGVPEPSTIVAASIAGVVAITVSRRRRTA